MYKPNYFQRRTKFQGPRTNHRIKSIDVQVINSSGENLGILPLKKAIDTAKQEGLDLIEISPNANPPVCKIMDMGKYKYDMQKKANKAKKNQKINYKIRDHSLSKVPFLLICGSKEIKDKSVTIRKLGSEKQETKKINNAIKEFKQLNNLPIN